eukprot:6208359-Pleurochrysis_carterae.AAC.1
MRGVSIGSGFCSSLMLSVVSGEERAAREKTLSHSQMTNLAGPHSVKMLQCGQGNQGFAHGLAQAAAQLCSIVAIKPSGDGTRFERTRASVVAIVRVTQRACRELLAWQCRTSFCTSVRLLQSACVRGGACQSVNGKGFAFSTHAVVWARTLAFDLKEQRNLPLGKWPCAAPAVSLRGKSAPVLITARHWPPALGLAAVLCDLSSSNAWASTSASLAMLPSAASVGAMVSAAARPPHASASALSACAPACEGAPASVRRSDGDEGASEAGGCSRAAQREMRAAALTGMVTCASAG